MEVRRDVTISNPEGLHARPCHAVVATANAFVSTLEVRFDGRAVNGKSILQLMTLVAGPGAVLELVAEGEDADSCIAELVTLIESGFGETS